MQINRTGWLIVVVFVASECVAQMSASDAFSQGSQSASGQHREQIMSSITGDTAVEVIKGFDPSKRPEGGAEFGGNILTTLRTSGSGKATNCVNGLNDGTDGASQHCDAVKAILETKDSPQAIPIATDDKLITLSRGVINNPEEIAGKIESAYSACETKTRTIGSDFELETCDEWTSSVGARCSVALSVTNDPLFRYECTETLSTIESEVCSIGHEISVDRLHNYQCLQHRAIQSIECNRTAIVTVEYGESPGPQAFVLGGQVMPGYKNMPHEYKVFIISTSLTVNPATKSGQLAVYYQKFSCRDWIDIAIYDPAGVLVKEHKISGCPQRRTTEYIDFEAAVNGTYRVYEYVRASFDASIYAIANLYANLNVEAPPPVVNVQWDDQCAHLTAMAQ